MLPSTLYIMRPMHLQGLKLLRSTVNEQMHLQENTVFDLDFGIKVTQDVAQHPLHHLTHAFAKFGVTTFNGKGDAFTKSTVFDRDLKIKVTQDVAKYALRHVTYAHVKDEVATSNGLGRDAITRKYII